MGIEFQVTEADTASALLSGDLPVLATPRLIAWLEAASCQAVRSRLQPGQTTVGTHVAVDHRAPSAVGASVVAHARLTVVRERTLSFEVEASSFGCWRPAMASDQWLQRYEWMDTLGERWWPIFGAVYFIVAVKRVRGAKLIGPAWKKAKRLAAAPVPLANRSHRETREPTLIE